MRAPIVLFAIAVGASAGCGGASDEPNTPPAEELETSGGSFELTDCGYIVSTRDGASAPVLGTPVLGEAPTPKQVHLGLAGDPRTTMVVQWRTEDETTLASTVELTASDGTSNTIEGLTFVYLSGFNRGERVRMHEAHLCGLTADTEYSYRVGGRDGSGAEHFSPRYTFRTAPDLEATPDAEVIIATLGDSRDGYEIWEQLAQRLHAQKPDLILFTGDAVTIGAIQSEWDTFFDKGGDLLAETPLLAAHGNHEINAINFFSQLAQPGDEENFALDYGPVHLTVLNDSPVVASDVAGPIRQFLADDLAAHASAPWKMILHHRSLFSAAARHGSELELRRAWQPLIDEHRVDLVLAGHDHNYERSKPIRGETIADAATDGTSYIVSGGAGAPLYSNGAADHTAISSMTHHALLMKVSRRMLELRAFSEVDTTIDTLTIAKSTSE